MRRLCLSIGMGLSSLSATAQLPPDDWFSSCDAPAATCMSPHVDLLNADYPFSHAGVDLLASPPCGADDAANADLRVDHQPANRDPLDVLAFYEAELTPVADHSHEILRRWELASQAHLPVTSAERLRLQYAGDQCSGQELSLTCELQGPVDADELLARYDWTVTSDLDAVDLSAVPKDRVERLFYKRFTVTLEATNWRPTALHFVSAANERLRTVALRPWVDEASHAVQVVAFKPAEEQRAGFVRTADATSAPPRRLPESAPPRELPPAPAPCETDLRSEPIEAVKPVRTRWGRMQLDVF